MRRAKSQSRKQSSRTTAGDTARDQGWRQFLDANQLWVEMTPDSVDQEVRTIERSIARREEEREIARALGSPDLVLLLN